MRRWGLVCGLVSAGLAACRGAPPPHVPGPDPSAHPPRVALRDAPLVRFPGGAKGEVDSNSPAHWDGARFLLFSSAGDPWRCEGPDLFHLGPSRPCRYGDGANGARWIECTWKDDDGILYGWYHNEPHPVCPEKRLTAPRIGAAWSRENGALWKNAGIVLEAPADSLNCDTQNFYFAGGNGDFSCMLDPAREFMYFFISTYHRDVAEQGVSVARMRWADRNSPVGKVRKWRAGTWEETGLGGRVTPVFPVRKDWHVLETDAFWGPSVHWNTHLGLYVMLLNHCVRADADWKQEGVYVSYCRDLSEPSAWTPPVKVFDGGEWYPQVIGIDAAARETDKRAGRVARFFMHGQSKWEIVFLGPEE